MAVGQPVAAPTQHLYNPPQYIQEVLELMFNAILNGLLTQPGSHAHFGTPLSRKMQYHYWPELGHEVTLEPQSRIRPTQIP